MAPPGPVAATVMFPGMLVSAGMTLSTTVTLKVWAGLVLPELSDAVQLTVVVPSGNVLPDGGEQLTVGLESTLSLAVGFDQLATAPLGPVAAIVISPGMPLSDGGVVSCTVTLKLAELLLPCESAAVQLTVVVPSGKVAPEAGLQDGVTLPSTRSEALAE